MISKIQIIEFIFVLLVNIFGRNHAEEKPHKSLKDIWLQHFHPHYLTKWESYADHYEDHLPKPGMIDPVTGKPKHVKLLEIGVQSGGSMPDWKEYYGDNSLIVGIDIDPRCKRSENPANNIFVEIGSQLNETFLLEVCKKYGPFDVIIDDGGHTDNMIVTSMQVLYPENHCLSIHGGIYAIEDLHTMVMKWYMKNHSGFTKKILASAYASMHDYWDTHHTNTFAKHFQKNMVAIYLYDSIAFFVKKVPVPMKEIIRGSDQFSNMEDKLNPPGTYGH